MSLQNYRYYCIDGANHLYSAEWFEAEGDEDAIAQVEAMHPNSLCEVWKDARLVAQVPPKRLRA